MSVSIDGVTMTTADRIAVSRLAIDPLHDGIHGFVADNPNRSLLAESIHNELGNDFCKTM